MSDSHSFNDIHRGVPLMARAVLVARLRELEEQGIIERRRRTGGSGHDYWLTPAGEALRPVVNVLGSWGLTHTRDWLAPDDYDPAIVLWGLRRRADLTALPDRRLVVRCEFSGVPASRTKFRVMWLVLEQSGADVCVKDPGFGVDLTLRGNIRDLVAVCLGHTAWRDVAGTALRIEGEQTLAKHLPAWLRLDKVAGRDFPLIRPSA